MPVNDRRRFLRKQGKGMHISTGAIVSDSAEPLTTNGCETNGNGKEYVRYFDDESNVRYISYVRDK